MRKWTVRDRYGNTIYFTEERWLHILESRPELKPYFDLFLETLYRGRRQQDSLIPNEYRYYCTDQDEGEMTIFTAKAQGSREARGSLFSLPLCTFASLQ